MKPQVLPFTSQACCNELFLARYCPRVDSYLVSLQMDMQSHCLCQSEVRRSCSRSKVRHWGVSCLPPATEPQGLRGLGSPYQGGQFSVRHIILEGRSLFTESLTIPCSVVTKETTRTTVPKDRWLRGLREATILDFLSLKEALSCHRIGGHS